MNFGLSEEQELLQETVRGFVANECPATHVRELFDGETGWDETNWKQLGELGFTGLIAPERYGGAGLELLDLALVTEILGEGAVPGPFFAHSLATLAVALGGNDAQREYWLPRLASGDALGTLALGEAGGLWQPEQWRVEAEAERLRGVKLLVPYARRADLIVVGTAGGELSLVQAGAQGVSVIEFDSLDRTRRVESLRFDDAPCEALASGSAAAPRVRDAGLILMAADSFGVASNLIDAAISYLSTREQFGTPLAQFQGIKHELANLATELEPSRGLYWYAAHAFDHVSGEAARMAALAKAHITDTAMQIARDILELHGGIGFTWECDVHIWYKRALFNRAFLGHPDTHRERSAEMAGW